ncbi:Inosine/uridine-preferring nucleoside hydrolase domain-containing protein [Hypoxylon trugodes]|uniref:Inosine/uridine-preferring nucleoside hydrolase domain-containing protein n=1 Tax=Hypoxylon trugodes TaxID=326681 RepID=UPI00218DA4A2|nr:Inosine/uridine-preferring nucleoside hydrolase domain-containing protein [Hypoxylon trugodes]KAI1392407.1 Inosine/uridine-preferring nucleoside hydrolase domain-containing protein [Hypoxylon trugodes]
MAPTRIILDTDLSMGAGADVDDGFALALAHADPDIQLELITTVNGNTDVESATILTGVLLNRLGIKDTPLVKGSATPIIHPDQTHKIADHVLALKDSARPPNPGYAPVAIAEHILANPGQITVVAIGPLTNIALALLLEPRIKSAIKELVIMGGIFFGTMYSRAKPGEFNVFSDPEAARTVLRSGIPQRWVGLDCTYKVRLTMDDAKALQKSSSGFAVFAGDATIKYINYQVDRFPGRPKTDSIPMHDPLAVAVVSKPGICEYRDMAVSVITGDGEARGVLIADRLETKSPPIPNCKVAVDVNAEAFRSHFLTLIQKL